VRNVVEVLVVDHRILIEQIGESVVAVDSSLEVLLFTTHQLYYSAALHLVECLEHLILTNFTLLPRRQPEF